jgi:hypothetical protein
MPPKVVWFVSPVLLPLFLAVAAAQIAFAQAASSGAKRSYVWFAELVSFDSAAKTMTAKAAVNEAVARYLDRFKPGQHIVLVWTADNTKPETGPVRYIEAYETIRAANVDQGYMLPAEFVAADATARTVTFKATVPETALQTLTAIQPGRSISVTTPMSQPSATATITSIEASDRQQSAAPPPKSSEKLQESPRPPRTR